jgi:hypothetical protein
MVVCARTTNGKGEVLQGLVEGRDELVGHIRVIFSAVVQADGAEDVRDFKREEPLKNVVHPRHVEL